MTDYSYLEGTVKHNPLGGREQITYRILGKSPLFRFTGAFIDSTVGVVAITQKCDLRFGPYVFKFMSHEEQSDCAVYVLKNPRGYLAFFLYHSTRVLDLIYRRSIITLAVWRLAEFRRDTIPTWRDIYILKKLETWTLNLLPPSAKP